MPAEPRDDPDTDDCGCCQLKPLVLETEGLAVVVDEMVMAVVVDEVTWTGCDCDDELASC